MRLIGKSCDSTKVVERQVICLTSLEGELRLAVLPLSDGKAATIVSAIAEVLDESDVWTSIKMIVCDTKGVNSGRKVGIVVRLQKTFVDKGHTLPLYVGCLHHISDRVLVLIMDEGFLPPT